MTCRYNPFPIIAKSVVVRKWNVFQRSAFINSVSDSADMFQIRGGVTIDGREVPAGARVSYGASNVNNVYRGVRQD